MRKEGAFRQSDPPPLFSFSQRSFNRKRLLSPAATLSEATGRAEEEALQKCKIPDKFRPPPPSLGNASVTPMWTQCISIPPAQGEGKPTNLEKLLWRSLLAVVRRKGERNFPKEGEEESCSPTHSRCKSVILAASEKPLALLSLQKYVQASKNGEEMSRRELSLLQSEKITDGHKLLSGFSALIVSPFPCVPLPTSPRGLSLPSLRDRPDTLCFSCGYCMHGRISQPASSRPCDGSLKTPQRGKQEGRDRKLGYCLVKRGAGA